MFPGAWNCFPGLPRVIIDSFWVSFIDWQFVPWHLHQKHSLYSITSVLIKFYIIYLSHLTKKEFKEQSCWKNCRIQKGCAEIKRILQHRYQEKQTFWAKKKKRIYRAKETNQGNNNLIWKYLERLIFLINWSKTFLLSNSQGKLGRRKGFNWKPQKELPIQVTYCVSDLQPHSSVSQQTGRNLLGKNGTLNAFLGIKWETKIFSKCISTFLTEFHLHIETFWVQQC